MKASWSRENDVVRLSRQVGTVSFKDLRVKLYGLDFILRVLVVMHNQL